MKGSTGLAVLLLLPWFLAENVCLAGEQPGKSAGRKIVVNASATVYLKPDAARLTFALTTETAAKAREENEKQVKKLKDGLAALSFKNVEIRVVPLSLNTITLQPMVVGNVPPAQGKQAQSIFFVTIREKDQDKLKQMVIKLADVAEEGGGVAVTSDEPFRLPRRFGLGTPETVRGPEIEWLTENTGEVKREAIKKAVSNARIIAQAAVGDAQLTVVEIQIPSSAYYLGRTLRTKVGLPDSGLIPMTVDVQITYSY